MGKKLKSTIVHEDTMNTGYKDNPAKNLLRLVEKFYEEAQKKPGQALKVVWSYTLDVDYRKDEFAEEMIGARQLIRAVSEQVQRTDYDPEWVRLALENHHVLKKYANLYSDEQLTGSSFVGEVKRIPLLKELKMCVKILEESGLLTDALCPDELKQLSEETHQLMELMKQADIPDHVREVLLVHLQAIVSAIGKYELFGNTGLARAVDESLKALHEIAIQYPSALNSEEKSAVIRFVCKAGQKLAKTGCYVATYFVMLAALGYVRNAELLKQLPWPAQKLIESAIVGAEICTKPAMLLEKAEEPNDILPIETNN